MNLSLVLLVPAACVCGGISISAFRHAFRVLDDLDSVALLALGYAMAVIATLMLHHIWGVLLP